MLAPAEKNPFADHSFDLITANQCWIYFDPDRMPPEIYRLAAPGAKMVISFFSWLPRLDSLAKATEEILRRHNPQWTAGNWSGEISVGDETIRAYGEPAQIAFDEPIAFTRESWRGRMRACRGVAASLAPEEVVAFDRELSEYLEAHAPADFTIHRIHLLVFKLNVKTS